MGSIIKIRNYKSYKGFYTPKNPQKYKGDCTKCIYRSLWERRFMQYCDMNDSVLLWSSEEIIIPYRSPLDGKLHRYFVDFWIKIKDKLGEEKCLLIEVKPEKHTKKPVIDESKKISKGNLIKIKDWLLNSAKWEAAKSFCMERNWEFKIITEKEIFGRNI